MKLHSIIALSFLGLVLCNVAKAQPLPNDGRGQGFWNLRDAVFQLGFNAIDDDNSRIKRMLDASKWSIPSAPTRFSLSKQVYDNYHFDIAVSAVRLKQTPSELRYVNPLVYVSLDLNTKYYANIFGSSEPGKSTVSMTGGAKVFDNMALDVYMLMGLGFQHISQSSDKSMATFNFGGGIDWWIKKNVLAINFQSAGKFALHLTPPEISGNLIHYSMGVCWKYNPRLFTNLFTIKPRAKYKRRRSA